MKMILQVFLINQTTFGQCHFRICIFIGCTNTPRLMVANTLTQVCKHICECIFVKGMLCSDTFVLHVPMSLCANM